MYNASVTQSKLTERSDDASIGGTRISKSKGQSNNKNKNLTNLGRS